MAIRYSGDVEVRFEWDPRRGVYRGTVRDPRARWRGMVDGKRGPGARESSAYDDAAKRLIEAAEKDVGRLEASRGWRGIRVSRVFQAPCPMPSRR